MKLSYVKAVKILLSEVVLEILGLYYSAYGHSALTITFFSSFDFNVSRTHMNRGLTRRLSPPPKQNVILGWVGEYIEPPKYCYFPVFLNPYTGMAFELFKNLIFWLYYT